MAYIANKRERGALMISFLKEPPWIFVCPSLWPRLYRLTLAKQFLIFGQQQSVSSAEMCRYLQLPQCVITMYGVSHELHLGELLAPLTALGEICPRFKLTSA